MLKNRRKTRIVKPAKRKSFKYIFLKNLGISMLVTTLIFILIMMMGVELVKSEVNFNYHSNQANCLDYILEAYNTVYGKDSEYPEDVRDSQFLSKLQFRFSSFQDAPDFNAMLYNAETGEILAGYDAYAFIFYRFEEEDPAHIAMCPADVFTELIEFESSYNDSFSEYYNNMSDISIDTFYLKDNVFYPGDTTLYIYSQPDGSDDNLLVSQTFEFAPENPEDYVKYDKSELQVVMGPVITGNGTVAGFFMPDSVTVAKNRLYGNVDPATGLVPPFEEAFSYTFTSVFTIESACETTVLLPNSEDTYVLRSVAYVDCWELAGKYVVIAAIVIYLLVLFFTFIRSKFSYAKLKAQYDLEDYRKTLMNTMAHDLKSPLMSISGYAENLKEQVHSEKRDYYADSILSNVNYMNRIISDILSLSQTENGNVSLNLQNMNIEDVFKECLKQEKFTIEEKNLKTELTGALSLNADTTLFTQAIHNLLTNAIRYADADTTIHIALDYKSITITNHCSKDLSHCVSELTKPFVTGDENRSNKGGSGLGLAIVQNIIQLHGYKLELEYKDQIFSAVIKL